MDIGTTFQVITVVDEMPLTWGRVRAGGRHQGRLGRSCRRPRRAGGSGSAKAGWRGKPRCRQAGGAAAARRSRPLRSARVWASLAAGVVAERRCYGPAREWCDSRSCHAGTAGRDVLAGSGCRCAFGLAAGVRRVRPARSAPIAARAWGRLAAIGGPATRGRRRSSLRPRSLRAGGPRRCRRRWPIRRRRSRGRQARRSAIPV